jgi:Protein of unknown function (DUF1566)/Cohesin domain/PEP-CTERM motif
LIKFAFLDKRSRHNQQGSLGGRSRQMVRRTAFALACILLGAVAAPNPAGAVPALPALTAGSDTVNVGDVFTIPISVSNVAGLTSFQFDLAFDPTIVQTLSFTDIGGDFEAAATAGGGFLTGITGFIDNTTGLLSGVADSISGLVSGNGLTPSGVIVNIEFQALAVRMSPLTLSNAFLTDNGMPLSSDNGDFLLQNGEVTVIGAVAVPEPSTLLLFSLAVAFVFHIHRGRRTMKKSTLVLALIGAITFASAPVGAQITQNGPYYANPSWDQQIPTAQRFIVLSNWVDSNFPSGGAAVLDRETGLVWQRSPDSVQFSGWIGALVTCHTLGARFERPAGNRLGWRLPNVEELGSLVDPTQNNPALPLGHPFQSVQNAPYWTATRYEVNDTSAYVVDFSIGGYSVPNQEVAYNYWCVRGGSGAQSPQ